MKSLKKISAVLLALAMIFSLAACGGNTDTEETTELLTEQATSYVRETKTKIASLKGISQISISKFAADREYNYETSCYETADEVSAHIKDASADLAVLPVDEAAKLYSETNGAVQVISVTALSFFHVLEKGEKIKSIADLKGKTVYAAYQGTAYEAAINYILSENGLDPEKDVDIQFKSTDSEAALLSDDGTAKILILPEPYASKVLSNNKDFRRALSLNSEWDKISETPLAQIAVVARTEYIAQNPDIIKEFISYCKIAVNYLKSNTYGAPVFLKENGLSESAELATEVLAGCNLSFLSGEEMKAAVSKVLEVCGTAVDEAFCYV